MAVAHAAPILLAEGPLSGSLRQSKQSDLTHAEHAFMRSTAALQSFIHDPVDAAVLSLGVAIRPRTNIAAVMAFINLDIIRPMGD